MLETLTTQYSSDGTVLMSIASAYVQMGDLAGSERIMKRMVAIAPESAETWYNLASLQAAQHKTNDALDTLKKAMQVNEKNPASQDLRNYNKNDHNFDALRSTPEFQRIMK